MKIEIGESLLYSWLRHVQKCQIVQLNWKPSSRWEIRDIGEGEKYFNTCKAFFHDQHSLPIFGQNSFSQLIQQAEVDVVGIGTADGETNLTLIDVAFHTGGLHYGPTKKTVNVLFKKYMRSVLLNRVFFNADSTEVIFATPKINPRQKEAIVEAMKLLDQFFEITGESAQCRLIANEDFFSQICGPLQQISDQVADTSELFMRSLQMLSLNKADEAPSRREPRSVDFDVDTTEKIGVVVQREFKRLLEGNLISKPTLIDLMDAGKSKSMFGLGWPVLKESTDLKDRFDDKGHGRYYSKVYAGKYLLCNQWFERTRNRLENWLKKINQS